MDAWFVVGVGGFLGAICRYLLSNWAQRLVTGSFPLGTLLVNVLGCLIIGFLMTLVETKEWFSPQIRLLAITGFLGSLTTFSTFGYETMELLKMGSMKLAMLSILANMLLGLTGVLLGKWMAESFF